jgi:hypothetical protein
MVRLKPWAPWIMADHYKKEKKKHYQNNLRQNRKPKSKDRSKKDPFLVIPKHFFVKLHEK